MRRAIWTFFLIVFCCLFFWRDILSIGLQGVVHSQLKCQLAFRQISFQDGQLVLDDTLLLRCSNQGATCHVRAKKIRFSIVRFGKPFHLHIAFVEPHLSIFEGGEQDARRLIKNRSKWFSVSICAENGTFECKDGPGDPLAGRFSLENEKLQLELAGGSMSAQLIPSGGARTIDCSFERMPVDWLSHRLIPSQCRGRISGALLIRLDRRKIQSASGRIYWEDAAFSLQKWQTEAGAESIEWEGDYTFAEMGSVSWLDSILSFPDQMKIKFHRGFISTGKSSFENLEGIFSNNSGLGLRWEVNGPSFSWEGKGFSNSRSVNWLESRLSMYESSLFLRAEQLDSLRSRAILELHQADLSMMSLLSELWPATWPCRIDAGTVSARLIWEESQGSVESWKLEQFVAAGLALRGDDWSFQCRRIEAAINHGGDAALSIEDSSARWRSITLSSLTAHCRIVDQSIAEAAFSGMVNGLSAQGVLQGNLKDIFIRANHFSGEESIEARANVALDGKLPVLSSAHLEARHLDLRSMQSFFSIDCKGLADLCVNYANGELKLEGAGSSLEFKGKAGVFAIDRLGAIEPFEAGVRAVWEKETRQWTAQTAKTRCECTLRNRKVAFEGQMEIVGDLLKICVGKGELDELEFAGDGIFALEGSVPFSFVAERIEGKIEPYLSFAKGRVACGSGDFSLSGDLLSDPACWQWMVKARLSGLQWGLLQDGKAMVIADSKEGLIECNDLSATLAIGNARFGICAAKLQKCDQEWQFDFRAESGIWDWGRLAGAARLNENHLEVFIDPSRSHLLNAPIDVRSARFAMNGSLDSLKLSCRVGWNQLRAASLILEKIDHSLQSLMQAPIQGAGLLEIDFGSGGSMIQLQGEDLLWKGRPIPLLIRLYQHSDGWEIDRFLLNVIDLSCSLKREEDGWKIEKGLLQWKDRLEARIGGYLRSFARYELTVEQIKMNLPELNLPFLESSLEGSLEGKGSLTMEWDGRWKSEADFDLHASSIKSGAFLIDNAGLIQVHFSNDEGLFVRGLDFKVFKSGIDWPWIYSRIGLLQFDTQRCHLVFHHSQMKLPADSLSVLREKLSKGHPLHFVMQAIDGRHDLEFVADIDCAADFSSLTCSMRDGFIPFLGAVRHLQNVNLNWNSSEMRATMSAIQGGHSLKIGAWMEFEPSFWGRIYLEDEEHQLSDGEMPMTIEWGIDSGKGLAIHSIEGIFGGIEASFHAENGQSLIGSTRLHFGPLSEIFPPRLGKVFQQLKMGKGYELKGHLSYDGHDLSNISFQGLLSGKQCELFGFQIRNLLTQVVINSSHVHFFELKASDSAGILTIDELKIHEEPDARWTISMPLFKLMEFRPSLLQKAGHDPGHVGPFVVRELKLMDLKGTLEEGASFTAKGDLNFVNSFKREHSVFDLPADFFGRIIGLDAELMIPVKGKFSFELKEGRIWLSDLEDAYSEGKRSKFFLVKEGLSPSIDLDGNLHIFVTMKQYVLFKITENFLLTIDGSIDSPSFHLQKKSKLLGFSDY